MKTLVAALAMTLLFTPVADAKCFLFLCFKAHHHVAREQKAATQHFCDGVKIAFAKAHTDADTFAAAFPTAKQAQVLECLR